LFTVGSLSLQDGSLASFRIVGADDLAGTAGTNYDSVRINDPSSSTFAGTLRLNFSNPVAIANGQVFDLLSFDGSPSISHFSSVVAAGTGAYASVSFYRSGPEEWTSTYGPTEQFLRFDESTGKLAVVPEPSTWAMLLAGGAAGAIGALRRRRQKMLGM
jgi:hypothetical protein